MQNMHIYKDIHFICLFKVHTYIRSMDFIDALEILQINSYGIYEEEYSKFQCNVHIYESQIYFAFVISSVKEAIYFLSVFIFTLCSIVFKMISSKAIQYCILFILFGIYFLCYKNSTALVLTPKLLSGESDSKINCVHIKFMVSLEV